MSILRSLNKHSLRAPAVLSPKPAPRTATSDTRGFQRGDVHYTSAGGGTDFTSDNHRRAKYGSRTSTHRASTTDSPIARGRKYNEGSGGNHEYIDANRGVS